MSDRAATREPDVELRLALAMRGGVSLAVWIGGACCEIDALRTATTTRNFWSDWLRRSGYERVVVDVLAGASAGGLNGVLYAASQVYGFPYEKIRDIWLRLGSTESLLRREPPYPSLFRGDAYFQREMTANLHRLIDDAVPPDRPPAVDLSLSVTYVEPLERPVPSPNDQRLTERRFASGFVFRHPGADTGWKHTDFPDQDGDRRRFDEAIARLGLAGRATSSFPGAFEAAAMTARRVERFGDDRPPAVPDDAVLDMGGVLMDRAETPLPGRTDPPVFVTDDGGILDNIPIGRALDSGCGGGCRPAHRPARRLPAARRQRLGAPLPGGDRRHDRHVARRSAQHHQRAARDGPLAPR
ncbi:MAG: patatin-like phospholipase family protein [Ilumatobacteraceae bacterium]